MPSGLYAIYLAKMIFSLLNIPASTATPSSVTAALTPTVTATPRGRDVKENTPIMHWTLLYKGMQ